VTAKTKKTVLVVDDDTAWHGLFRDCFSTYSHRADCPCDFEVDGASSAADCVQMIRAKRREGASYDVILLDIRMEEELSGIKTMVELAREAREEVPLRIVFTGFPTYKTCVQAMRHGAWDYILKEDVENRLAAQIVVESALSRLRELDLRRELENRISEHLGELQLDYAGKLVALWHEPEVHVIASGSDAFELEDNLKEWRKQHASWKQPFILRVPC